jgi:hypothetical protein
MQMVARAIGYLFIGVLCLVGPILLVLCLRSSIKTGIFIHDSVVVDGTILSLEPVYVPQRSRTVYKPVFRFWSSDGQIHLVMADSAAHVFKPFKAGDRIRVLYPADHPELARINTFAQMWSFEAVSGFLGAALTMFPIALFRRRRAKRRLDPAD